MKTTALNHTSFHYFQQAQHVQLQTLPRHFADRIFFHTTQAEVFCNKHNLSETSVKIKIKYRKETGINIADTSNRYCHKSAV